MFCTKCGTKNPDNSAYCYDCGQKMSSTEAGQRPSTDDAHIRSRTKALATVLVAREVGLATDADVDAVTQKIQKEETRVKASEEAIASDVFHYHFFTAVDSNGVTRFFDLMQDDKGFSIAETATRANRLGPCSESVFEVLGGVTLHHVHRVYGGYSFAEAATAQIAMQGFATFCRLTKLSFRGETLKHSEARPIWHEIFGKLGCPTGGWSLKTRRVFNE